ncbi:pentapeptide repeat-containing protein [Geodermatophilus sp. SYSU D00710]
MSVGWTVVAVIVGLVVMVGSLVAPPLRVKTGPPGTSRRRDPIRIRLRRRRLLLLGYLALIGIAAVVYVIGILPSTLTRHPEIADAAARHQAIAQTRNSLVAILAAAGALGGLAYTARTYRLSREGQITQRYAAAIQLLGSERPEVRLGGIYALERLMRDSPSDQPTIVETLAAYVRERTPCSPEPTSGGSDLKGPTQDVQAVLTVLRRRRPTVDEGSIDLTETNLAGGNLSDPDYYGKAADLRGALLNNSNLNGARLDRANLLLAELQNSNLSGAVLSGADLTYADLSNANLAGAQLQDAILEKARLHSADLSNAQLGAANLLSANLSFANMAGAWLIDADFRLAVMNGTILSGARVTSGALDHQQMASARISGIEWQTPSPDKRHH